ncbi:MAG: IS3 family transposase [Gammaproteobacteria bacterium (ex Lamellibrachia satsuma)]|nr:MAG: IS3 family transposase [Gammaproteobacteria bacterium (ex Lamellibrachia satsuma)]QYZ65475.1 MAG: IS3 family transposase [Gammaproteobacteria bacterium (ex Lamellibrachia satsuma)]
MKERKKYSKEFKLDAVSLVLEQEYTRREAANSLGINAQMLGRLVKEHQAEDGQAFRGNGKLSSEQEEIRKLKAQVKRLEMEKEILKKGNGILCSRNEVKYSFITQHKNAYPISLQCQVLGVSRNGYYQYQRGLGNRPDRIHQEMLEWVEDIAKSSDYTYGSRRMKKALNVLGYPVSRNKARKLMREANVQARQRRKYKVTTNSNHQQSVFNNLLKREFAVAQPDHVYAADVTYVWTQEGWLYLAVVIDLYSRKVVGWSMSSRMKAKLVCDALQMAIWRRRPKGGLIHHSDRGSQYASKAFRRLLKAHDINGSMSRKGDCWDNAVVESFFGSLKQERVHWRSYQTRYEAQQDILEYISMFYNSTRLHSYLDYMSPNDFEQQMMAQKKAA